MKKEITVHCIAKNEEKWIWYSLMSVLDKVDRVLVYDTGSTDKTIEIIKSIKSEKIIFKDIGNISQEDFPKLRQQQIDETETPWFFILDADEIWENNMLEKVLTRINQAPENILAVFVHYFEFVNDLEHYYMGLEQKQFPLHNRKEYGWYTIRFIKKVPGLVCSKHYGLEGYFLGKQELQRVGKSEDYLWCDDVYYFHTRNLLRSSSEQKDKEVMQRVEKRHLSKIGLIPKVYRGIEIVYPQVLDRKII